MKEESVSASSYSKLLKLKDSSVHAPQRLGKVSLLHDEDGFYVLQNNKPHKVKNDWVDPILRTATNKRLESFQKSGYISVNQLDNGEFSLKANVRGLGGGPVTASMLYWVTKAIGYGVPVALGTTAAVAALPVSAGVGVASGATAGAGAAIKVAGGVVIKGMVGGGIASTGGTAIVANTIIGTVGTTAATNAVVGVTAATASTGGYVGFIEGLAATLYIWGMAAPTP